MPANNSTLPALALAVALAAPGAYASAQLAPVVKPVSTTVTKPITGNARATDAVSARTTARESGHNESAAASAEIKRNPGRGNWWVDADIDGDGQLSATEAKANAGLDSRFSTVDADADGYVTNEEYRRYYTSEAAQGELHAAANSAVVTRDLWLQLDGNADGKLSSSEVSANAGISAPSRRWTPTATASSPRPNTAPTPRRTSSKHQGSSLTMVPMA